MNKSTNWIAEDLNDLILKTFSPEIREHASQLNEQKRVHEVYVEPGRISSRIIAANKRSERIVLTLPELPEKVWSALLDAIATDPFMTAQCYNHHLSHKIRNILDSYGVSLFGEIKDYTSKLDDKDIDFISPYSAAVLEKFAEQLISNPISIFTMRGKNSEQVLHEIRELRAEKLLLEGFLVQGGATENRTFESPEEFYGVNSDLPEINVRADELPAAVLRRLDPIPLEHLDIDLDMQLELAYGRVARLSQSLARFLP